MGGDRRIRAAVAMIVVAAAAGAGAAGAPPGALIRQESACPGSTPGAVSQLAVTAFDPETGDLWLSFAPACGAADHHIELGPLDDVSVYGYSAQVCGLGSGGTYGPFNPGPGDVFFLVVGDDGVGTEGSYGVAVSGGIATERPADLLDPACAFVQDLSARCDVTQTATVGMTGFRPQSEAYGAPLQRTSVPEDQEETPGVGLRVNGDDDDGDGLPDADDAPVPGDNDLVEVTLLADPPCANGVDYVLSRSNSLIRVWEDSGKGLPVLTGAATETVLTFTATTATVWVEAGGAGIADLQLTARSRAGGGVLASERLRFFTFTSIVIALGGENQVPADPPLEPDNHGVFQMAIDLYGRGYDVHMYDEDVVAASGAGAAFDEVVVAVRDRAVTSVAIFGYSHGGGSTNDLARRLDDNRAAIGVFDIGFTAYVDGIDNDSDIDTGTETALPPSTLYHANYYENPGCGFLQLCGGPIAGADFDLNVNTTPWGASLGHFTIDDAPEVKAGIRDQLMMVVPR